MSLINQKVKKNQKGGVAAQPQYDARACRTYGAARCTGLLAPSPRQGLTAPAPVERVTSRPYHSPSKRPRAIKLP